MRQAKTLLPSRRLHVEPLESRQNALLCATGMAQGTRIAATKRRVPKQVSNSCQLFATSRAWTGVYTLLLPMLLPYERAL
jgi:hypothetical protein